ncbi:MAG TPA: HU family DNA-binding protein [Desulfuromonadales bacterium]|nr:HU family DNA-binding protein [Desulfuromonadales bacterium]
MTKAELINSVAEQAGLKKVDAEKAVTAFVASVTAALKSGDKLSLVGFGTFSTAKRAARKGQNPQTGKKIDIPAATVPKFKPGKTLKEAVNVKAAVKPAKKK